MPEGLFQPDFDIRRLTIDPVLKKSERFEIEKTIDETTWQFLLTSLKLYKDNELHRLPGIASDMKLIFPERASDLELTDAFWNDCMTYLKHLEQVYGRDTNADSKKRFLLNIITTLSNMKILFPERSLADRIDQVAVNNLLAEYNDPETIDPGLKLLFDLKILTGKDPIDFSRPSIKEALRLDIQQSRQYARDNEADHSPVWGHLARRAAMVKICLGNNFNNEDITEDDWQHMEQELKVRTADQLLTAEMLADLALHMKILAANGVTVTDRGIVFREKPLSVDTPVESMPEQRGF
jgi:hypothetical protein